MGGHDRKTVIVARKRCIGLRLVNTSLYWSRDNIKVNEIEEWLEVDGMKCWLQIGSSGELCADILRNRCKQQLQKAAKAIIFYFYCSTHALLTHRTPSQTSDTQDASFRCCSAKNSNPDEAHQFQIGLLYFPLEFQHVNLQPSQCEVQSAHRLMVLFVFTVLKYVFVVKK